ncbi:hypothetical protein PTTG_12126 [Puccinia triticina 1-1 BBBD Race 1]|uniref:Peptidase S8/S53 domain-containing protein n=1 Tax=Puccinia triticina (isolate 1-1 / race 1 (BBBD)) TaxID=630390 RepID=A0A180GDM9_PUCT1|nr:hypothetical protein PTTG_12126 [Puccinia triticina 1-1 BBBD Race 1]
MLTHSFYCFICFALALATTSLTNEVHEPPRSPQRYLVSLDPARSRSLEEVETHLKSKDVNHEILLDFTDLVPDVFCGFSLQMFEDDLQHLESFAHVKEISRLGRISRPGAFQERRLDGPPHSKPSQYPPHIQTRISKLHEMGIYGQGVKVALIDDGIDCAHPAFGSGFGLGFKIGFGKSFVNDDGDGIGKATSGASHSPCTPCGWHGTSTAGMLGSADVGYGPIGAAPNVTLGMYRVAGCKQGNAAYDDVMMAAMLQAHKDAADVISISMDSVGGWGEGKALSQVANRLVQEKGAIIIVLAGNQGNEGLFLAGGLASARNVIAVGSVESQATMARSFTASTGKKLTLYRPTAMDLPGEYPVYMTANSTDATRDACDELLKHTPDLTNYIVLIKQGDCSYSDQAKRVVAKGARQILFYLNSTRIPTLPSKMSKATISAIPLEDGRYIFDEAKKNPAGFKVSFPPSDYFYVKNPDGGLPSEYSTYGPSFDFESPQPAVAGVGGRVVTTLPIKEGSYALSSGTSMSTPQIAGIAALILSARGKKFTGLTMRSRLTTTAKPLNSPITSLGLDSVVHQGGGLVDAFCAAWTNTTISVPGLVLNDSISFRADQEFTISNNGTSSIDYVLSHRPAITLQTFSSGSKYGRPDLKPIPSNHSATARISPVRFRLSPGSSQSIKVNFSPPEHLDPRWLSVYSGYVVMASNFECESHNVPYYGVVGSLKKQPIIDRGPNEAKIANYPYLAFEKTAPEHGITLASPTANPSPLSTAFVWNLKEHNMTSLHFRMLFGSLLFRFDILPGNTVLSNGTDDRDVERYFRGTRLIGAMPVDDPDDIKAWGRSSLYHQTAPWNGTVITRDQKQARLLPSGSYRLLFRALRVTGQKDNGYDYDHWISPQFKLIN